MITNSATLSIVLDDLPEEFAEMLYLKLTGNENGEPLIRTGPNFMARLREPRNLNLVLLHRLVLDKASVKLELKG